MKNILLVGPYPPPYGGIATHIVGLAPFLAEAGYNVTILMLTYGKNEIFSPYNGVEVLRVNAPRLLFNLRNVDLLFRTKQTVSLLNLEYIAREVITANLIRKIVEERKVSLIESHAITSSLFVPHLKKVFGNRVKFATTIFGELVARQDIIIRNKAFYKNILLQSDQVLATSQYCANLARSVDFDPANIEVIYIGVDLGKFSDRSGEETSNKVSLPRDKGKILFVGRFHEEMGLDVILEVIPDVVRQRPDICFLLVGAKGPLTESAAKLRDSYSEHVFIHQDVSFDLLPAYYANSQILLAPSVEYACMGVSIKEAMAAGKAIITTNAGGIPEAVIDGQSGIVLDLEGRAKLDKEKLTRSILFLLNNPKKATEFSKNARERAGEIFDIRISLQKHLAVVERLIGKVA